MDNSGSIEIALAQLDIPINYLFVSINLPADFEYNEFTGGLKEVSHFSRSPPMSVSPTYNSYDDDIMPQAQMSNAYSRRSSISSLRDSMEYDMKRPLKAKKESLSRNTKYQTKGVLPVKVEMPVSGQEFKFEQLIVMGNNATLTTTYKRKKNTSYGHKRTRRWWNCCC